MLHTVHSDEILNEGKLTVIQEYSEGIKTVEYQHQLN